MTLILDPRSKPTPTSHGRWACPELLHGQMQRMAEDHLEAIIALLVKKPLRNAR